MVTPEFPAVVTGQRVTMAQHTAALRTMLQQMQPKVCGGDESFQNAEVRSLRSLLGRRGVVALPGFQHSAMHVHPHICS